MEDITTGEWILLTLAVFLVNLWIMYAIIKAAVSSATKQQVFNQQKIIDLLIMVVEDE